jgi:hypothetical protein
VVTGPERRRPSPASAPRFPHRAAIVEENATARLDGLRSSLVVLAFIALIALFFTRKIPTEQPASIAAM